MRDLMLDEMTHDLVLSSFDLVLVDGIDRVRQQLNIRLWIFLGEWFLDTSYGIPYFEEVLIKNPDYAKVDALFKAEIISVPDVLSITEYISVVDKANRSMTITFSVNTTFGSLTNEVTV